MDRWEFFKIVLYAEKKGYKGHLNMLPVMPGCITSAESLASRIFWTRRYEIIFSHSFAKAFFGKKKYFVGGVTAERWQYYLKSLVLEEDPLEFIHKYYKEKN